MSSKPLKVDPARVERLEAPLKEFRERKLVRPKLPKRLWMLLRYQLHDYYFVAPPLWRRILRARTWQDRPVPEFASIGVVRSGTSTLANYILQHPCVALPLAKEPAEAYTLKMVRANFPTHAEREAIKVKYGQAITGYCAPAASSIMFPYAVKALNPDIKIILILRDPVDRAFSHWRWDQKLLIRGSVEGTVVKDFPSFDELIDVEIADAERGGIGWMTQAGISGYLRQSIYLPFITVLHQQFDPQQVKIVNASEFFAHPAKISKEVYEFLGLPECEPILTDEKNPGPSGKLNPDTAAKMRAFFKPHNERLYDYLGRDLGWD